MMIVLLYSGVHYDWLAWCSCKLSLCFNIHAMHHDWIKHKISKNCSRTCIFGQDKKRFESTISWTRLCIGSGNVLQGHEFQSTRDGRGRLEHGVSTAILNSLVLLALLSPDCYVIICWNSSTTKKRSRLNDIGALNPKACLCYSTSKALSFVDPRLWQTCCRVHPAPPALHTHSLLQFAFKLEPQTASRPHAGMRHSDCVFTCWL